VCGIHDSASNACTVNGALVDETHHFVGSKKTPSNCPDAVPGCTEYPITTQPGEKGSIIVNINTSHSIEKYPEDNTSD
jgi:hypothetical protein